MRTRLRFLLAAGAFAACLSFLPWFLGASEPVQSDPPAAGAPAELDDQAVLADCLDPAFGRYVDVRLVGKALNDNDAALMTDAGLQLAEGERVLLRSLPGLSSETVFRTATKMAATNHDKTTLARLAKAAAARADKEWAGRIAAAEKLAGESRDAAPGVKVSVETTSPEQLKVISGWYRGFHQATALQDAEHLEVLGELAPLLDGLDQEQQEQLAKQAAAARKEMEEMAPPELQKFATKRRALQALAAASRGWNPHIDISPDPINFVDAAKDAEARAEHAWTKKVRDPVVNIENAPGKAIAKTQRSVDDERARIPLPYDGADMDFIQVPGGKVARLYPALSVTAPNGGYVGEGLWNVYITRRPRATFSFQVVKGRARMVIARVRLMDDVVLEHLYADKWCTEGFRGTQWVEYTLPPLASDGEAYCALMQLGGGSHVNVLGLLTQVPQHK